MDDDSRSGTDEPHAAFGPRDPPDTGSSLIDYRRLIQAALRVVPREALRLAANLGMPSDHHFFIDFQTEHAAVEMPARLFRQFPSSMRIVLQHQFSNLLVEDDAFEVDLRFGGEHAHLRVPFAAMTAFIDPAAGIVLGFEDEDAEAVDEDEPSETSDETDSKPAIASVVSLDAFRKRDRS